MKKPAQKQTTEQKVKATAKNKIRRIEKQIRLHPKTANNKPMMERLEYWKTKI